MEDAVRCRGLCLRAVTADIDFLNKAEVKWLSGPERTGFVLCEKIASTRINMKKGRGKVRD